MMADDILPFPLTYRGEVKGRIYTQRNWLATSRVLPAAVHAASVGLEVAPGEMTDALVRRCVQHLWPEEASS
jgi:hypothetical protein